MTATVLPLPDLVSDVDVAALLGVSPKTLANWRSAGVGPSYFKIGGRVRYDRAVILTWLDAARVA
ncbi:MULTISPECIES: helix-turn-helix transcriptional regulator [Curtobacterium]|uniref:DNA-binding transcriptional regulator AlpA n=1 Tax=Curtobacterium pusillum TaxID=69373 RepID=A0AAW3SYJ5_9MICO|nr:MULTISPECIES: helix-turn-helix domain-containing protein [unclassified Curtobacterium]MBA8988889.1 putative DNA-binding transcriptional regulator AlpA [Curtobacterium pusillum]MDY1006210.1 helix-turn-helix domain-containing protein [Curtobacterium sp. CFBP9011]WIE82842.1 helix-turn-helix domain-containing protein [Curtobacterium sp. MCPF17_021]